MICEVATLALKYSFKEPVTVELGITQRYRQRGFTSTLVDQPENFQYVPLIEGLNAMFDNEEFLDEASSSFYYIYMHTNQGFLSYIIMSYGWPHCYTG